MWRIAIVLVVACASAASTQQPRDVLRRLDADYFAGRPADVLLACDSLLTRDSTDFEVLWRGSRAALVLGMLGERQDPDTPLYLRANALAMSAIRVRPDRVEGHYLLAAASGRRALHAELRTAATLANTTLTAVTRALAIDSMHAGSHDVLGKLHSEVRRLPAISRFLAGRVLGVSVARTTSWETAEQHLRRAVELDSTMILYRLDLAEMYQRTGRTTEATRLVKEALAMPRLHPIDAKLQREALALLGAH